MARGGVPRAIYRLLKDFAFDLIILDNEIGPMRAATTLPIHTVSRTTLGRSEQVAMACSGSSAGCVRSDS